MEPSVPYGGMPPPASNATRGLLYPGQSYQLKDSLVSPSPSPTLEFYGTLSPIPGARVDMVSPAPTAQLPIPVMHPHEDPVVRLQTPTEYGRRGETPAPFNEPARLETPTYALQPSTSMSPSRFTADFDRQPGALPNFAAAPPADGVRPHAVRPSANAHQLATMLPSIPHQVPSLQGQDLHQHIFVPSQQQMNVHTQLSLFRQGQAQASALVGGPPSLINPYRTSPVPYPPSALPGRKLDEPPLSMSPTPAQQVGGQGVVMLPQGARIIHHQAPTDSTIPSVVTPDVRHWKHEGGRLQEDRVALPRQYARGSTKRKPCNCKQSRCLKLYCECFAAGLMCQSCNCVNCANNPENDALRQEAIRSTMKRSPPSQKMNKKNCHCKKSNCVKKYCECFQAGVPCSGRCKCTECRNRTTQQGGADETSHDDQVEAHPASPIRLRPKRRNSQPTFIQNSDDGDLSPAAAPPQRPVRSKRRPSIVETNDNDHDE